MEYITVNHVVSTLAAMADRGMGTGRTISALLRHIARGSRKAAPVYVSTVKTIIALAVRDGRSE